ncbi:MAG: hypothetical protein ACK4IS_10230 [Erythrobacter sp.]
MPRPALASLAALVSLPLAVAAGAAPPSEASAPSETFRQDQLADPAITEAIRAGAIDITPSGEIIVQGTTEKEIRNFVWRTITPVSGRKIAIRIDPVCISFDNIDAGLEAQLRQRIAQNLATIGRELAEPGCRVNTSVAFPRNAHAFVSWLSDTRPGVFGAMYRPERRRHIRPRRMAYNWHYVDSKAMMREIQRAGGTLEDVWQQSLVPFSGGLTGGGNSASSRILPELLPEAISHSFTVIEAGALEGITPVQLADYLTMHTLVMFEPGLREEIPAGSILRLFDEEGAQDTAAEEMSAVDRVVLGTIYRKGRRYFSSGLIRAEIARTAGQEKR